MTASSLIPSVASQRFIDMENAHGAHNYHPIPVVAHSAQGCWVTDVDGKSYLDMMSAYSAVSLGHNHPRLIAALVDQASKLTVTSRAYHNDILPRMLERLSAVTGLPKALPMNSGAEAVETAIKAARKWGETVKGIPKNQCEILVCANNFHGRTTAIVGFSSEAQYQSGFGPFTGGFRAIPFGDAQALEDAIGPGTCAFLVEPIQGEAGIITPPAGYLAKVAEICKRKRVLLIADEIQTGFARTGTLFAFQKEIALPDALILGKALGGGLLPISALCGSEELMGVFAPGDHGSTFGGNPLAARIAFEALELLSDPALAANSRDMGERLMSGLRARLSDCPLVAQVRGAGLFIAVEVVPGMGAREVVEDLAALGLLSKETHGTVIRLAPPLTISAPEIDLAIERLAQAMQLAAERRGLSWRA